eukprot:m.22752 g.22752  ORF g.22752 m.22752 type:complete len:457 (+) comp28396_c0_seq1:287-1657(+)
MATKGKAQGHSMLVECQLCCSQFSVPTVCGTCRDSLPTSSPQERPGSGGPATAGDRKRSETKAEMEKTMSSSGGFSHDDKKKVGSLPMKEKMKSEVKEDEDEEYIAEIVKDALTGNMTFDTKVDHGVRKHLCPICGKGFKRPVKVRRHLPIHTKKKGKKTSAAVTWRDVLADERAKKEEADLVKFVAQACSFCGRFFTCGRKFRIHRLAHEGLSPYQCKVCDKNFTRSDHLSVHLKSVSHLNKERELRQRHEPENYVTTEKDKKSNEQAEKKAVQGRPCEQCDRVFLSQRSYRQHIRQHQGLDQYICKVCNRKFTRSDHLRTHYSSKTHQLRLADAETTEKETKSTSDTGNGDPEMVVTPPKEDFLADGYVFNGDDMETAYVSFAPSLTGEVESNGGEPLDIQLHSAAYSAVNSHKADELFRIESEEEPDFVVLVSTDQALLSPLSRIANGGGSGV